MSYSKLEQLSDSESNNTSPSSKKPNFRKRRQSQFRDKFGNPIFHPEQMSRPSTSSNLILTPEKQHFTNDPQSDATFTDSHSTKDLSSSTQLPKYSLSDEKSPYSPIPYGATDLDSLPDSKRETVEPTAGKLSHKRKQSGNNVRFVVSDTVEKTIQTTEFAAGLVKRTTGKVTNKQLSIDTSSGPSQSKDSQSSARSSSTSYFPKQPNLELIELSDIVDKSSNTLLSGNQNGKGRTRLSVAFQEYRFGLLSASNPRTKLRLSAMADLSDITTIDNYLKLTEKLRLRPVFFDPELDVLNRYCLEFTSIAVKTTPTGFFTLGTPHPIDRVYNYMDKRVNSIGTPVTEEPIGPDVPVLLTQLFLNQFRIRSNGSNDIQLNVPIFSHSNRLSNDRFSAITNAVFDRRSFFFRNIDIGRHSLADLA